jgi:hypothetical protein
LALVVVALALVLASASVLASADASFDRLACLRDSNSANVTMCFTCAHAMAPLPCEEDACASAVTGIHETVMRETANNCRVCDIVQTKLGFHDSVCAAFCLLSECTMPTSGYNVSDRAAACYAALRYHCPLLSTA